MRKETIMRWGAREILLAVAVVLFVLAIFLEANTVELLAGGLAAFALGVLLTGVVTSRWGRGLR